MQPHKISGVYGIRDVMQGNISVMAIGVVLCGLCHLGYSRTDVGEATTLSESPKLIVYVRDTIVTKEEGTILAVEIRNLTAQPLLVNTEAKYTQQHTTAPGVSEAQDKEKKTLIGTDEALHMEVTVHVNAAAGSKWHWNNTEADPKNPIVTIENGRAAFVKVAIPSSIVAPGPCTISIRLRRDDKVIVSSDPKVIECVLRKDLPSTQINPQK